MAGERERRSCEGPGAPPVAPDQIQYAAVTPPVRGTGVSYVGHTAGLLLADADEAAVAASRSAQTIEAEGAAAEHLVLGLRG